jgi:hypothetical protein
MAKTIQFRCPVCNRLLIKWQRGSDHTEYIAPGLRFVPQAFNDKKKDVICTKCDNRLEITMQGLVKITLKNTSETAANEPALAK